MMTIKLDRCISAAYADALFASALQCSDAPSPKQVRQAIAAAADAWGDRGCAARVAQAYGDRPETAVTRMRWARTAVASIFGSSRQEWAHAPQSRQCTMLYAGAQG
jgi:hypothetical protein